MRFLCVAALLLLAAPPLGAAELDAVLGGFEEDDEAFAATEAERAPVSADARWWNLTGSASLASSINFIDHRSATGTDYTDLQKLRGRLNLQLDLELPRAWKARFAGYGFYDFAYRLQGRSKYTDAVLDDYEWEVDSQDMYVRGEVVEDLDLKVGRQIVNWGRSDTLRVLDVLNPLDNREPGLADIEDLRLPVSMARLDYYRGAWSLTAIAIPEMRFDKNPPVGSDFVPSAQPLPPERTPTPSFDHTEWAARAMGIFEGWDVSLHFARYWDDTTHLAPGVATPFVARHSRLLMAGAGGNYTLGSWLFKGELAYIDGLDYTVVDGPPGTPPGPMSGVRTVDKARLDTMGGIEYYGIAETSIALEIVNRHIHDFESRMRAFDAQRDALEGALRITADFMNARLHTTVLGVVFGERAQDGSIVRLEADYDLRDAVVVTAGILLFQNGDPLEVSAIDDNDRLFFEIKYSF